MRSTTFTLSMIAILSFSAQGFAPSTRRAAKTTSKVVLTKLFTRAPLQASQLQDYVADDVSNNEVVEESSLGYNELVQAEKEEEGNDYKKGFAIISLITLFNASLSPVWHAVYEGNGPPPLFLNAVVSIVAFLGLFAGGSLVNQPNEALAAGSDPVEKWSQKSFRGGVELGLWKGIGTTCHVYGMALTTANHGAFLLQLTTLIVPVLQGLRGAEVIPRQVQVALGLALTGIVLFTQDPTKASEMASDPSMMQIGDGLVLAAAFFYSLYDIQTFYWGKEVDKTELVTIKVGFQCVLACALCATSAGTETVDYLASGPEWSIFVPTVLWSGLIVNSLATFLQVGGMQSVGPSRAQTIFASQPLWAAIMNYFLLGSTLGVQGCIGGGSFLGALFLAASAEAPTAPEGKEKEN